ncbi:STAS domain-containing protein [Methanoregula sp.]|uniref:STAS domain-containing protein n=1 Tax=Methanoregula sp. TaxID=2052170 RepID=UPI000CA68693|nr:STAS domain-containing protein [Methanoregula sp.]PKG31245.1 MAG: anti-sigma factor antagonist [Methanoregula sp.]
MEVACRKEKNTVIVSVTGRMDALCSMDFEKILDEQIAAGETRFILDLSGLEYISSAGLQCVLTTAKKLEPRQGDLILAALKGTVKEVFEISGFSSIFTIAESVDSALAGT